MHARSQSNSFRINLNLARSSSPSTHRDHVPLSSPPSPKPPRRRSSANPSGMLGTAQGLASDGASWMGARVGRTGLRRWMIVAALSVGALLLRANSASNGASSWSLLSSSQPGAGLPEGEVPMVDRSALEKLRLLEIHFGADEDDPSSDVDPLTGSAGYGYDAPRRAKGEASLDAPPLVVEIPEVVKANPSAPPPLEKVPADVLDEVVCGARDGRTCQFLVPAWLGEQETKAQQHLYQLGLLALALNRTLVLPNVSKSRLGTCYRNPFAFYYSPSSLSALGIHTISQDDFVAWTMQRDPAPSAQVVSMGNARPTYPAGAIEIDSASDPTLVPAKPSRNLCLRAPRTRLDFSGHSPLAIYPPEGYHRSEAGRLGFGESVVNTLRSHEVGSKSSRASSSRHAAYELPDVLAFNYELRFPIMSPAVASSFAPSLPMPEPFAHFPYAEIWTSLAEVIAHRLSPFIAIHWRTETLTPANLAPCAQSLLKKLISLKQQHPSISNVYLATDYPIEALDPQFAVPGTEAVAHSGTFAKVVTEQHHAAMRRFLRDFERQAKGLRLTTFAKEQASLTASSLPPTLAEQIANLTSRADSPASGPDRTGAALDLEALDSGLYGILDKAIAMRAELFLTGVPGIGSSTVGACAKLSSFTNQLIGAREEVRARQRDAEGEVGEGEGDEREVMPGRLWNAVAHWSLTGEDVD
ncbi:hypothetical protein JCM5296_007072 [Sporobolomyces johnsonii]